ncbi:MAG TPA: tRNA (adenosine(37)-N6)-dimethylallyltransferase MiaA [Gammaproteobacteria bacterium]|nr:tRNA (adenosine(37)-N6)-dimethylallyltransferase MiaA [Gammaproteobacteria bacterium]
MTQVLVITGPTASGKSQLAYELAEEVPLEVISVDSAQVYRGFDIGSAKPDAEQQRKVRHHLIDIRDASNPYSAADFRADAVMLIEEILSRQRLPVLVGGSMLYIKALRDGIANLPAADPAIRSELIEEAEQYGWTSLHDRLKKIDPQAASRIKAADKQRLQRALEVHRLTGQPMSQLLQQGNQPCPFELTEIAIIPSDRKMLHLRIAERFDQMLARGLIDEVINIRAMPGIDPELPALKAVGYRQVWNYLEGQFNFDEMRQRAIAATRQLAKRQYTWLRSWPDLAVLDKPNLAEVLKIVGPASI